MKTIAYISSLCPYCRPVKAFIEKYDLDIEIIDVNESIELMKELNEKGGKAQVPMLFVDGKALYESRDILNFLRENKERFEK